MGQEIVTAIVSRIQAERERREWSQDAVAKVVGVSRVTYNRWENGSTLPAESRLMSACEALARAWDVPIASLYGREVAVVGKPLYPVGVSRVPIPMWGEVPASDWSRPADSTDFYEVDASLAGPNRIACRIVGDSMIPYLQQGDVVVFKLDPHPAVGSIVLARNSDNDVTVKHLAMEGGGYVLASLKDGHTVGADRWEALGYAIARIRDNAPGDYDLRVREAGLRPNS